MDPFVAEPQPVELPPLIGGLNTTDSIQNTQDSEATVALNVDFSRGTIGKRQGRVQIGSTVLSDKTGNWGFHFRQRDGTNYNLVVFNARLYKDSSGDWKGVISGTNPGSAADVIGGGGNRLGTAIQYVDRIYYMDGALAKRYTPGTPDTIRNWSFLGGTLPAPTIGAVTGSAGSLGAGDYSIVYTYRDPLVGDETDPSTVSATVTVAVNTERQVTIPANANWTPNYTQIRIYRTIVNGAGAWFFERELNIGSHNLSTTDYTFAIDANCKISVADSSLGSEVSFDNDPVPIGKYVIMHDERAIVSGVDSSPSTVYWSERGKPWAFPASNAQDLLKDDGRPVRGLFTLFGFVYVGKKGGPIFQLAPHPVLGYAQQIITDRHGIESHHSIVSSEFQVMWADKDGIIIFNGQQAENFSDKKVRRTYKELLETEVYLPYIFGIYDRQPDKPQVHWMFSTVVPDIKEMQLSIDIAAQAWYRREFGTLGQRVAWLYEDPDDSKQWIYAADANGKVYRWNTNTDSEPIYNDNGSPISFKWYSKWFGDPIYHFLIHWVDIEYEVSAENNVTGHVMFKMWADGDENQEVFSRGMSLYDTGSATKTIRFSIPARHWRRFRFGFDHNFVDGDISIVRVTPWVAKVGQSLVSVA